jgi:hypothetical protein
LTATITKHGVFFGLPGLSITFDRARRCLLVEGHGESSEAPTGTSYPFSLIDTIHVAPQTERVSTLAIVFQRGDRLVLCRVERELATRLAWVLGDVTRAAVELETTDTAPLGPKDEFNPFEDPTGPIGMSVVTRLLDRRGPDTQELLRSALLDDDSFIPEVDPSDVIELVSTSTPKPRIPSARPAMPRSGTPRTRQVPGPARPRRSSVRDTSPDTRAMPRWDSESGQRWPT